MLKNRIIPCLDVKNGRVVKGINFVDLVDAGDPVEQAKIYDEQGADELCFLDITASNENRNILLDGVKKTAEKCFMPLTVGGGVRTLEDIRKLLLVTAAVFIDTLSAPAKSKFLISSKVRTPPPTVKGIKHFSAVFFTVSNIIFLFSFDAVMSKKHNSSAPCSSYIFACSAGSPASFKSTKLIPFTTLPFFTSKQGIILFFNILYLLSEFADFYITIIN